MTILVFNLKAQDFKYFGVASRTQSQRFSGLRTRVLREARPLSQEERSEVLRGNAFPLLPDVYPGLAWALFPHPDIKNNNSIAEKMTFFFFFNLCS